MSLLPRTVVSFSSLSPPSGPAIPTPASAALALRFFPARFPHRNVVASAESSAINLIPPSVQRFSTVACKMPGGLGADQSSSFTPSAAATDSLRTKEEVVGNVPVVSASWLHQHLNDPNLKVLDASWYMPAEKRRPLQEFKELHIPGSLFFDIEAIADITSDLPHMLPSESAFSAAVSALGIRNDNAIVVYDGSGIFSAARAWWMFRVFGHKDISVLDGGLPHWRRSGCPVDTIASPAEVEKIEASALAVKKFYQGEEMIGGSFKACLQKDLIWSSEQVMKNLKDQNFCHIDARGRARFGGTVPEPRKGVRAGHVPGSKCIPFSEVLSDQGVLLGSEDLLVKFKNAGIPLESPIVASCGTGVTACILALALYRLGREDIPIYDGSWTEWGALPDAPVATVDTSNSS